MDVIHTLDCRDTVFIVSPQNSHVTGDTYRA